MTYYLAVETDSGCFIGCNHKHRSVISAAACISSAGGYVVAVEKRRLRELIDAEDDEFRWAMNGTGEQKEKARRAYIRMLRLLRSGTM